MLCDILLKNGTCDFQVPKNEFWTQNADILCQQNTDEIHQKSRNQRWIHYFLCFLLLFPKAQHTSQGQPSTREIFAHSTRERKWKESGTLLQNPKVDCSLVFKRIHPSRQETAEKMYMKELNTVRLEVYSDIFLIFLWNDSLTILLIASCWQSWKQ